MKNINLIYGKSGSGKEIFVKSLLKEYPNLICKNIIPANEKWKDNAVYITMGNHHLFCTWIEKIIDWSDKYNCKVFIETNNEDVAIELINKLKG